MVCIKTMEIVKENNRPFFRRFVETRKGRIVVCSLCDCRDRRSGIAGFLLIGLDKRNGRGCKRMEMQCIIWAKNNCQMAIAYRFGVSTVDKSTIKNKSGGWVDVWWKRWWIEYLLLLLLMQSEGNDVKYYWWDQRATNQVRTSQCWESPSACSWLALPISVWLQRLSGAREINKDTYHGSVSFTCGSF